MNINDFIISELPNNDIPTRKCRAVICDVCVVETDPEYKLGNIDIVFMLLSPSFEEAFIFEKHFTNLSIESGIEAAFDCLIDDNLVSSFYDLIGTAFDAEIQYRAYNSEICTELILRKMVLPPPCIID